MRERHGKSIITRLSEIASIVAALGVLNFIVQIGEYKEKIKTLCDDVRSLGSIIDANAAENTQAHISMRKDITRTQQAVVAVTGKPIQ